MLKIITPLGKTAYYCALPLAFLSPDARTVNALLGATAVAVLTKSVAGVAMKIANKRKEKAPAGYTEKSDLRKFFDKATSKTTALALAGGTALATAGYIGANTYNDIQETDRTPIWALAGNIIDAAAPPVRWAFGTSADIGQAITQNLNPIPEEYYMRGIEKIDAYPDCWGRVIDREPSFAGTCPNRMNRFLERRFDRR
jgi:hypothetical protein